MYKSRKAEAYEEYRSKKGIGKLFLNFKKALKERMATNIFNVLMNTIQFMEYTMAKEQSMDADIYVHPVVPGAGWADFHDPDKFIKAGEMKTEEVMADIKRLARER